MLTKEQRQFLKNGGRGYDRRDAYAYREGIKQRVRHAILDFSLLLEHWDEAEREEVFHEARDDPGGAFDEALADMLALVYLETFLHGGFKNRLLRGVNEAERQLAGGSALFVAQVDFKVEPVYQPDLDTAIDKFRGRRVEKMTRAEQNGLLHLLRNEGSWTGDDVAELRDELDARLAEYANEMDEAAATRADTRREKQRRVNERRREETEGDKE